MVPCRSCAAFHETFNKIDREAFPSGSGLALVCDSGTNILDGGEESSASFAKTDRILAEMEGIGIAALFAGLGAVAKFAEGHFEEGEKDESFNL
jgi:hypothetical protein